MNELFELLMRNIGLIIVIAGFLLTFATKLRAGKNGQPGKPGRRPSPMMPSFGGDAPHDGQSRPQRSLHGGDERRTDAASTGERTNERGSRQERLFDYADETVAGTAIERSSFAERSDRPRASDDREAKEEGAQGIAEFSGEDAVRGIIWAEIMGPPRAKKPYRPGSR